MVDKQKVSGSSPEGEQTVSATYKSFVGGFFIYGNYGR